MHAQHFKIHVYDINKHGFQVSKYIMSLINGQLIQCLQGDKMGWFL